MGRVSPASVTGSSRDCARFSRSTFQRHAYLFKPLSSRMFFPSSRLICRRPPQAPIPAVCATPPSNSTLDEQMALNNALRRLGVAFNVSVDRRETSRASDESSGARDGGTKCRADGVDKAVSPGGFGPSPVAAAAVAAAARKRSTLPAPVRPATTTSVKSQQQRVGLDKGNSLTTPVGLGVS